MCGVDIHIWHMAFAWERASSCSSSSSSSSKKEDNEAFCCLDKHDPQIIIMPLVSACPGRRQPACKQGSGTRWSDMSGSRTRSRRLRLPKLMCGEEMMMMMRVERMWCPDKASQPRGICLCVMPLLLLLLSPVALCLCCGFGVVVVCRF